MSEPDEPSQVESVDDSGDATHTTSPYGTGDGCRGNVVLVAVDDDYPRNTSGISQQNLYDDRHYSDYFYGDHWRATDSPANDLCTQWHVEILDTPNWERTHIRRYNVRGLGPGGSVIERKFHRLIAPQFLAFFWAAEVCGASTCIVKTGGAFRLRTIGDDRLTCTFDPDFEYTLSNHATGCAVDINDRAEWNGKDNPTHLHGVTRCEEGSVWDLVDLAGTGTCLDFGVYWGGWYQDPMHFEVVKVLEEEELRAACEKYGFSYEDLRTAYGDDFDEMYLSAVGE